MLGKQIYNSETQKLIMIVINVQAGGRTQVRPVSPTSATY
jgi:hypothetical protein